MQNRLRNFLKALSEASRNCAVLVEGKRDRWVLESIGVKNIFTIAGIRLTDLPDLLEGYQTVILLFDLDKHGESLSRKAKGILSREGYILIETYREKLRDFGITCVEDIYEKVRGFEDSSDARQTHKIES